MSDFQKKCGDVLTGSATGASVGGSIGAAIGALGGPVTAGLGATIGGAIGCIAGIFADQQDEMLQINNALFHMAECELSYQ